MAFPNAKRPAPAGAESQPLGLHHAGQRDASSLSHSTPEAQALVAKLAAARDRVEANRQIAEWCIALQARLWAAEAHLLHDNCRATLADLAIEIERFKLCCRLARDGKP